MHWPMIIAVMLCAVLSDVGTASAWNPWISHDAAYRYSDKASESSRRWELRRVFVTHDECIAGKQGSRQRLVRGYDDLSRHPGIERVDSITDEAVFLELKQRDNLIGGQDNQHFHCMPDTLNPR